MGPTVVELLQRSIESSVGDNEYLKEYLKSCIEHGVFYSKNNVEFIVKTINTSLNSSYDKEKGLILLSAFLHQIPTDAFSNNAIFWMIQCSKIINQKGEIGDDLSFTVLTKLIKLSVEFPEINREVAKEVIPKLLVDQVKRRPGSQVSVEFLECLQTCLSKYSGPSGDFKTDILRLLLSLVDKPKDVVGAAACCIPLIAQVGGGGKLGVLHKTSWRSLQLGLVNLLHTLLNKIYQYVDCCSVVKTVSFEDKFSLEPVNEGNILSRMQRLSKQFISVAHYLQAMLLQEFPVAKAVAPEAILDVISHAQKPTHSTLGSSREALAVTSVLPSIQRASLHLLQSLILCLGRNLVPYAGLVNHLCCQVVVWTHSQYQDWPYAMDKPYSETRYTAYSCLESWFTVMGAASRSETLVDKALPVLLSDIYVQKPSVKLKVGSKTKKGKKKQQMLINVEDRSEKLCDSAANHILCEKALRTLAQLVSSVAPYLKPDTLLSIQQTVLTVCTELPVPYTVATCRSSLYQLLLALCLAPHPKVPPPLASAIAVFITGTHHPNPQVKATCISALGSLEKIVHPMAASLYFPLPQDSLKSVDKDKTKEESESSDSEVSEKAAKKRRLESVDEESSIAPIVLDDSDENVSVKSLEVEIGEEKIEVDISDDSVGTVNVISEDSRSSDGAEKLLNESAVDVTKITDIESENISKLSPNKDEQSTLIDVDNITNKTEEPPSKDNSEGNVLPIPTETSSEVASAKVDDADVSEMLMDFNDEVNNDS